MFAIIKSGARQYKVAKGEKVTVEKLDHQEGEQITLDQVMMLQNGADIITGAPLVAGAKVIARVVEQNRAKKVIIFKKRRRKNYRRKNGHRQPQTVLMIEEIRAS